MQDDLFDGPSLFKWKVVEIRTSPSETWIDLETGEKHELVTYCRTVPITDPNDPARYTGIDA